MTQEGDTRVRKGKETKTKCRLRSYREGWKVQQGDRKVQKDKAGEAEYMFREEDIDEKYSVRVLGRTTNNINKEM